MGTAMAFALPPTKWKGADLSFTLSGDASLYLDGHKG
jgi:hypothetical protein